MRVSDVFGGGGITPYIDDGATAKIVSFSSTGVMLDTQERGVFTIAPGLSADLEITIDGKSFSGSGNNILRSLYGVEAVDGYTVPTPYFNSLKVEVTNNPSGTTTAIYRIS